MRDLFMTLGLRSEDRKHLMRSTPKLRLQNRYYLLREGEDFRTSEELECKVTRKLSLRAAAIMLPVQPTNYYR